MREIFMASS